MDKWLQLGVLVLGLVDKIWAAFKKTPSEKIRKSKAKLEDKIAKRKKTGRPQ